MENISKNVSSYEVLVQNSCQVCGFPLMQLGSFLELLLKLPWNDWGIPIGPQMYILSCKKQKLVPEEHSLWLQKP